MVGPDRELLARLMTINQAMGEVVLRMMAHQDGGQLNTDDLRAVGDQLARLGADMVRRADVLDIPVIDVLPLDQKSQP